MLKYFLSVSCLFSYYSLLVYKKTTTEDNTKKSVNFIHFLRYIQTCTHEKSFNLNTNCRYFVYLLCVQKVFEMLIRRVTWKRSEGKVKSHQKSVYLPKLLLFVKALFEHTYLMFNRSFVVDHVPYTCRFLPSFYMFV